MKAAGITSFAIVGSSLTAITFGLARYAFGLFVPSMRADLALAPDTIGVIGSLAFVGFALVSLIAPAVADRLGARNAAVTAAALATTGLALMAAAGGPVLLGAGVLICGVSTGLMMPSLTAGMHAAVRAGLRGRVTAIMNAGTSIGVVACAPAMLLLGDDWRIAYAAFAGLAAVGLVAAWLRIPSASRVDTHTNEPLPALSQAQRGALLRLVLFGFGAGIAGSAFWIFAPDLVAERGGLGSAATALLWLAVGIAGMAAAWTSDLADRIGMPATNALAMAGVAAGTALLAVFPGNGGIALAAAAVFGVAFMSLAGLHLVTAVRLLPRRPALAGVAPFLAITIGQAAGSPLVGGVIEWTTYASAFFLFAGLALALGAVSVLFPNPSEETGHVSVAAAGATGQPAAAG